MSDTQAPEGFTLFPQDGTFDDVLYPMYYQMTDEKVVWSFKVTQKQSNMMGMCHGGAMMTLMDFALSAAVCQKIGKFSGTPTISMSFDFFAKAVVGDWIFAEVEALKITNTMGFAQGLIKNAKGEPLVRASGNFKLAKNLADASTSLVTDFTQA